ncbi:Lrp/AsnC family transcriptional regulator [Rhodobacteraceae bacterium D3-12]|nr:Lrp/AsnC family transcriptional regulator [Rhodobacteraceae bacterium D3-12]
MSEVDAVDLKIIEWLENDSRISVAALAEKVGLSQSTCWRRVSGLEKRGVIRKFSIVTDPEAIGLVFKAIVHVQLARHDRTQIQAFFKAIRLKSEIKECYATTGQSDCHLLVQCENLAAYNQFLDEFLYDMPAVANAQTNVVLQTIKH